MDAEADTPHNPLLRGLVELPSADGRRSASSISYLTRPGAQPCRNLVPVAPLGRVIYRDEAIVRRIYDRVVTIHGYPDNPLQVSHREDRLDVLKCLGSVEWRPSSDTNFDYLVSVLSTAVTSQISVRDLVERIHRERMTTTAAEPAWPGMPVRVCGSLRTRSDVSRKGMRLRVDEYSIDVALRRRHSLGRNLGFLARHHLFVLGILQEIGRGVTVQAGAVLL